MTHAHDHSHGHSHNHPGQPHGGDRADTGAKPQRLAGERSTRQRAAIREALASEGRPLTPPEILALAQRHVPGLGIATVYRNIKAMADVGEIAAVSLPGDRLYYELSHRAEEHHHHFRCNRCEKVFDIEGCDAEFAKLVPKGFKVQGHDLTLYGVCAECSGG